MAASTPGRLPDRARYAGLVLATVCVLLAALSVPPHLDAGHEWAAAAVAASLVGVGGVGLALFLAPGRAARWLDRLGVPPTGGGGVGFCLVVGVTGVLFGVFVLGQTVVGIEHVLDGGRTSDLFGRSSFPSLMANLTVNLALFLGAALGYVVYAHRRTVVEGLRQLGYRGTVRDAVEGIGWGLGGLLLFGVLGGALTLAGVGPERNVLAELITSTLTLPQAVVISLMAAVGEETFFRGFLQPRIGLFPQAALFGLAHATYLNVFEVIGTVVLALAFGMAFRRTESLYAPIAGHAAVNVLVFVVARFAPTPT